LCKNFKTFVNGKLKLEHGNQKYIYIYLSIMGQNTRIIKRIKIKFELALFNVVKTLF